GRTMMKRMVAMLAALACTAAFTSVVAPASAENVSPNRGRFAALGDSYAAGVGNPMIPRTDCGQSVDAYPVRLAGAANKVTFLACSGATTAQALAQVARVPVTAREVTVTIGGNDVDFVGTLTECAKGEPYCTEALQDAYMTLAELPSSLGQLVGAIHAQAPSAQITVTGYPILFQATDACAVYLSTTRASLNAVDTANAALNQAIGGTVASLALNPLNRLPVRFVSVEAAFEDHGICSGPASWIFPVTFAAPGVPNVSSLHPTAAGQSAYASAIKAAGFPS
ncbi:MAG TPA: SGNH/GDSL hydrolase family protein, partial [Propionibacteriaceae bacterium]|nr:SGNH/GDSL hydrolase family protein [Propionibacteriaceae bacterium]